MKKYIVKVIEENGEKTYTFNLSIITILLIISVQILFIFFALGVTYFYSDYVSLKVRVNKTEQIIKEYKKNEKDLKRLKLEISKLKKIERKINKIFNTSEIKKIDISKLLTSDTTSEEIITESDVIAYYKSIPLLLPTTGWITTGYIKGKHEAIDIATKKGTPVIAPGDGKVISVNESELLGKEIVIKHDKNFLTRYAHLDNVIVKIGQKVKRGDIIAYVGNSGKSYGAHLHYEVIYRDNKIDPLKFLKKYGVYLDVIEGGQNGKRN